MGKLIDLKGLVFGKLLVIKRDDYSKEKTRWICKCSCNRTDNLSVLTSNLRSGHSNSCKKCQYEKIRNIRNENLIGKVFGSLTVISSNGIIKDKNEKSHRRWTCVCSCGRNRDILSFSTASLNSGHVTSCPTCGRERISKKRLVDLSGKRFGKLRVVKLDYIHKKHGAYWICFCDTKAGGCGNYISACSQNLKNGHSVSCGCTHESDIATFLKNYFRKKYKAKSEYKIVKNNKTGYYLPFDIYIPCGENKKINGIYIEINGEQHYRFYEFFHKTKINFNKQKERDKIKKKFARDNGIYIEVDIRKITTAHQAIKYIENYFYSIGFLF